jgi:limonene-1,2-epoxide hydrolase
MPAVGIFEFEDGFIKVWREYYDLATLQERMDPDFQGDQ